MSETRDRMTDHEQMLDAQAQCVPCKLCGGSAVITDAGTGAGYYIACGNSVSFRDSKGCLINERRLGGWAYNVMDWWNRLHAVSAPTYADGVRDAAKLAMTHSGMLALAQGHEDAEGQSDRWYDGGKYTAKFLAAAIATLPQGGGV